MTMQNHYYCLLVVGVVNTLALENDFELSINIYKLGSICNFSEFAYEGRLAKGRFPGFDRRW